MRQKDKLVRSFWFFLVGVLVAALVIVWGTDAEGADWPLWVPFDGSTVDTCWVTMYVDSGGTGFDSTSIDSFFGVTEVDTSFTVDPTYSYMRKIRVTFFTTGDMDGYTEYLWPLRVVPEDTNIAGEEIAVMPDHFTAADSAGFQGAAAGVTVQSVFDTVWGTGSTYKVVDSNRTEQGGAGTGAYRVDWYAMDTLGGATTAVQGALLTVKNWSLNSVERTVITDANGDGVIQLDNDSIAGIFTSPLYNFPLAYDSIKYTTDTSDTIYGYLNVPAAAPGVSNIRVYLDVGTGKVDSAAGTALPKTRVEYRLSLNGQPGMHDDSWMFIPEDQVKRPDTAGRVQFDVVASTSITTGEAWYELSFRSLSRYSQWSGVVFKFEVDTLTDPISIIDCEQVP